MDDLGARHRAQGALVAAVARAPVDTFDAAIHRSGEAAVGEHAARAVPGEALVVAVGDRIFKRAHVEVEGESGGAYANGEDRGVEHRGQDRKSTRLNSSH